MYVHVHVVYMIVFATRSLLIVETLDDVRDGDNDDVNVTSSLIEHSQLTDYHSCRSQSHVESDWLTNTRRRDVTTRTDFVPPAEAEPESEFTMPSFDVSVYALPLFGLVLIIVTTITSTVLARSTNRTHYVMHLVNAIDCLILLMTFSALVVVLAGFYLSTKFKSHHVGYSAFTVLVLVSTFFMFVYDVIRLVPQILYFASQGDDTTQTLSDVTNDDVEASAAYTTDTCPSLEQPASSVTNTSFTTNCVTPVAVGLVSAEIILHTFQVYAQTSLLIHLCQVKPRPNGVLSQNHYQIFKSIATFLILYNVYCWINVSFIDMRYQKFDRFCLFARFYYEESLNMVWGTMLPIIAFYRFQSFAAFLMYYLQY